GADGGAHRDDEGRPRGEGRPARGRRLHVEPRDRRLPARVPGRERPRLPAPRVTEICRRRATPLLDLAPRLAGQAEGATFHVAGDGHWNARGHEAAALETARFLLEETDLWRRALEHA